MNEAPMKALYIALLTAMLDNIVEASTERAHNHIKLMFALSELTGLRSQRLDIILPKWQTLALACWKALPGQTAVDANDYGHFDDPASINWSAAEEMVRAFLGMFQATETH